MTVRFLLAAEVAEAPQLWSELQRRELVNLLARVVDGTERAFKVTGDVKGVEVVPFAGQQRVYFQRLGRSENGRSWIDRRKVAVTQGDALQVLALRTAPTGELCATVTASGVEARPLASLSELRLRELGVPADLIDAVRGVEFLEDLTHAGLPGEVMDRLRTACVAVAPVDVQLIPEILKYDVPDLETFRRYYRGDLKRLLLNLEAHQRELVDLEPQGPTLVKGVAGSGKTTVALYRARRLLLASELVPPRILILSYTRTLTEAASELLVDLCQKDIPELTVKTVHAWCKHYLESQGQRIGIIDNKLRHRDNALKKALEKVALTSQSQILRRSSEFWFDEIGQVIKGRCAGKWVEYRSVERVGRGEALKLEGREVVWRVFEAYQKELAAMRRLDWDDLILRALAHLEQNNAFEPYDYVFLDEAQDLPVMAIRVVSRLTRNPAGLFFMADGRQSIYQKGFRWKDVGLEMRGRQVHTLKRSFRSTIEISQAASSLGSNVAVDEEDEEVIPPVRHGPRPRLVACAGLNAEVKFVASRIAQLVRSGAASPGNIGVLARPSAVLRSVGSALNSEGVPVRLHKEGRLSLGDQTVKLLTLHSAKGLEFPIVFILGLDKGVLPEDIDEHDKDELAAHVAREKRLLYVGMTRAIQDLTLVHDVARPSVFVESLDKSLFEVGPVIANATSAGQRSAAPTQPVVTRQAVNIRKGEPQSGKSGSLVQRLAQAGVEYVDKRQQGGALWVIRSPAAEAFVGVLTAEGVRFNLSPKGGRATNYRPAWFTKNSR